MKPKRVYEKLDNYATSEGLPDLLQVLTPFSLDVAEVILAGLQIGEITPNGVIRLLQEARRLD